MAERTEEEEEGRRGWIITALFFLLLLLGCGLYYLWLSISGNDSGSSLRADNSSTDSSVAPSAAKTVRVEYVNVKDGEDEPEPEPDSEPEPVDFASTNTEPEPPEPPARVFEDRRWLTTSTITGSDDDNRFAKFSVHVLSGANAWAFGSSRSVDTAEGGASVDSLFSAKAFGKAYCGQSALMSVGAASYEGSTDLNLRLAGARAGNVISAIRRNAPQCEGAAPRLMTVNLGEHGEETPCPGNAERCPEATAFQRPILLVSGQGDTADMDYGAALKNAIKIHEATGRQILPRFQLSNYSRFDVSG